MISKKLFKNDGNSLLFAGNKMEIYLPTEYFKNGFASPVGSNVNTLGIFNFKIMGLNETNKGELHTLMLPTDITFSYSNMKKDKLKLSSSLDEDDYLIYELYNEDIFIERLQIIENSADSKKFIDLLHSGKIPNTINYNLLHDLYYNSLNLNHVSLGVSSVIIELILAELARNKKDLNKAFRFTANENNLNDYRFIPIKTLPELNSTFAAISFENMNHSIITAINHTRNDDDESVSPLEKTIKY